MENQNIQNPVSEPANNPVSVPLATMNRNPLVIIFSLLALVLLASTAFLYYQNQQLKSILAFYQILITYTPAATPDETANWKTYENQEIGFSVKYPNNFYPVKNNETNVAKFASNDSYLDFEIAKFSEYESWIKNIKESLENGELNVRFQKIFDREAYLESRQSSGSIFERNIFIVNGTSVLHIKVSADENKVPEVYKQVEQLADQILSTFKFINWEDSVIGIQTSVCCSCPKRIPKSQTGKDGWVLYENGKDYTNLLPVCQKVQCHPCEPIDLYICPETGWVDCMPRGPNVGVKYECTSEAINWYKANCPNFKGIAQ